MKKKDEEKRNNKKEEKKRKEKTIFRLSFWKLSNKFYIFIYAVRLYGDRANDDERKYRLPIAEHEVNM